MELLERGCKISSSLHQSTSLGNLGLRSVWEPLWGSLLATWKSWQCQFSTWVRIPGVWMEDRVQQRQCFVLLCGFGTHLKLHHQKTLLVGWLIPKFG